jgi:hypothetical protein
MAISGREYVCLIGIGDLKQCKEALDLYARRARALNLDGEPRRASHYARIFLSEADILDECRDVLEISAVSKKVFPVLWVNLTIDPHRVLPAEIQGLESELKLSLLGTVESRDPFT